MAQPTFHCKLITPEGALLDQEVTGCVLPAWDGMMGILPRRAPIVAKLGTGELSVTFPDAGQGRGGKRAYFVDEGFLQMAENSLLVLARRATAVESLTEGDINAEISRIDADLAKATDPDTQEDLRVRRRKAEEKLRLERAFRKGGGAI